MLSHVARKPGPEVIKLFHAQLSTKFQLLIKTKKPTNKEVSCFKSRNAIFFVFLEENMVWCITT